MRRIVLVQVAAGSTAAVAAGIWQGWPVGLGLLYGALLVAASGIWLARRIGRAAELTREEGRRHLYGGAVARFLLLLAALVVAHYALRLHLLAVAAGILLAYAVSFFGALLMVGRPARD